jgi:hypothetical protein
LVVHNMLDFYAIKKCARAALRTDTTITPSHHHTHRQTHPKA